MRKLLERLGAMLAGVLLTLLLLEGGLRIVGAFHAWQAHRDPATAESDALTVLCLGDSFTWGAGAPAESSYPRQLQVLLDQSAPGRYRVVNRGVGGQNTAQLLETMPGVLSEVRPDLVILLSGSANIWNKYGFKREDQASNFMARIRVYKLWVLVRAHFEVKLEEVRIRRARAAHAPQGDAASDDFVCEGLRRQAEQHRSEGQVDEAAAIWEKAIRDTPDCVHALLGLGRARLSQQRYSEARDLLNEALDQNPYDSSVYLTMGELHAALNDSAGADRWVTRAIELAPLDASALNDGVRFFITQGQVGRARTLLADLEAKAPLIEGLDAAMALVYEAEEDYATAVALLERAMAASPDHKYYMDKIVELDIRIGDLAGAERISRACAAEYPDAYHSYLHMSWILVEQDRLDEALVWAKEGARISPMWVSAQVGEVYELMGDYEEAIAWFRKAVDLNPEMVMYEPRIKVLQEGSNRRAAATHRRQMPEPGSRRKGDGVKAAWVARDLKAMVAIADEMGIPVLLQDYPVHTSSRAIQEAAAAMQMPLVSNERIFADLPDRDSYFAPDGHCNALGYGLMAQNLLPSVLRILDPAEPE